MRLARVATIAAVLFGHTTWLHAQNRGVIPETSRISNGSTAAGHPAISGNGNTIVYLMGQAGALELHVWDELTQKDAVIARGPIESLRLSASGNLIAYVQRIQGWGSQVFMYNRLGATSRTVSRGPDGSVANADARQAAMSPDGGSIVFVSAARNLDPRDVQYGKTTAAERMYLYTVVTQSAALVGAVTPDANSGAAKVTGIEGWDPVVSDQGAFVAFATLSGIGGGDANQFADVYTYERATAVAQRVSINSNGIPADGPSEQPAMSGDGRYVAFVSRAGNLADKTVAGQRQVYLRDRTNGVTTLVSVRDGAPGNGESYDPRFSPDGKFLTFTSEASNLEPCDSNGTKDVFLYDVANRDLVRASVGWVGAEAAHPSDDGAASDDGIIVAFATPSSFVQSSHLDDWNVYTHYRAHSARALRPPSAPPRPMMDVFGVEITQGVQDLQNSVPLIERRRTFVRVHIRSRTGETVTDVSGALCATPAGTTTPTRLEPLRGYASFVAQSNRKDPDASLVYELPLSMTTGTVKLSFQGHDVAMNLSTGSTALPDAVFREKVPPYKITFVPVVWKDAGGLLHRPARADAEKVVREIEAVFPVAEVEWTFTASEVHIAGYGRPSTLADYDDLSRSLKRVAIADRLQLPALALIEGDAAGTVRAGEAVPEFRVASAYFTRPDFPVVNAHELGHLAGREHTPGPGDPPRPDLSYPNAGGNISPQASGPDAIYGFDHRWTASSSKDYADNTVHEPTDGDVMSYRSLPIWISNHTYVAVLRSLQKPPPSTGPLITGHLVSGVFDRATSVGTIDPLYPASASDETTTGQFYTARLLNQSGSVLATHRLGAAGSNVGAREFFAGVVPFSQPARRIEILRNGSVVATRTLSPMLPVVVLNNPAAGQVLAGAASRVTWLATDPDGDTLSYAVQYSEDDGATWRTLAFDVADQFYDLPVAELRATTRGRLRIVASDGLTTVAAVSPGPFTIPRHAPNISITVPTAAQRISRSQWLVFQARAYDTEDGDISAAIAWATDVDDDLATGSAADFWAGRLTAGNRVLTVTVKDADGNVATASVPIVVVDGP